MIKVLSKRNMINAALFGLILAVGSSCVGPEEIPKPENLLPEDTYIDLLVEVQHVITYRNAYPDSVNADSLMGLIYDKYQVTEEEFSVSHEYYQTQVKEQITRVDEALRRLRAEEEKLQARIDSVVEVRARQDSLTQSDTTQNIPTLQNRPALRQEN